jgi:hypothetical protein
MSRVFLQNVALAGIAVALSGCAQPAKPLYMWEAFPRQQYDALLSAGVMAGGQIAPMEAHAEKARGAGAALPPGFRAHLGMLKLADGDADRARQLWLEEKTVFPESGAYMDRLLQRLDTPVKTEKPA